MTKIDPRDAYLQRVQNLIREHGRAVVGVIPEAGNRGFSYTVGNVEKGLPELLIIGCDENWATALLNDLSQQMIERNSLFGEQEEIYWGPNEGQRHMRAFIATAPAKARFTKVVSAIYGDDYEVMQIVVPDPQGRFPWDESCDQPFQVEMLKLH